MSRLNILSRYQRTRLRGSATDSPSALLEGLARSGLAVLSLGLGAASRAPAGSSHRFEYLY
jgi:hypothetical protein